MTQTNDDVLEVILDEVAFPLNAPLNVQDLTRFQGRIITGSPSLTSNPLLSTWVINNLMGGHGIDKLEEGTDQNRYRFSTLYARIPNALAMPRHVATVTGTNTTFAAPGADLYESGEYRYYASFGDDLVRWDEDTLTMSASLGDLAGNPVNKPIEYQGTGDRKLFFPCGANGYSTWDGSAIDTNATPLAQAFCVWDNKLICLDVDGQLHWTVDGNTWTGGVAGDDYGEGGFLDPSFIPVNLVVYYDRSDNPAIHVVTNRGVWVFDPSGPRLWQFVDFSYPPHPSQAAASAVWRGSMYVSNGMGMSSSNGSLINPGVGLDRDNGLPTGIRGYIQDLHPEYNGLYALVQGSPYASVHVYTGFGWHCEYTGHFASDPNVISWLQTSSAQGQYRLWWGEAGDLKTMKLPTDFANPRALTVDGVGSFHYGITPKTFESGWFDAEMENYVKVANTLEVRLSGANPNPARFYYRRNGEIEYSELLYLADPIDGLTTTGRVVYSFGVPLARNTGFSGVPFYDIEIKAEVLNAAEPTTPIIDYMALTYRQMIPGSYSWVASIDLTRQHKGNSPEQLRDKLNDLIRYAGFFEMVYQGKDYRVVLSQQGGSDQGGRDTTGVRSVNILEVPATGIQSGFPSVVTVEDTPTEEVIPEIVGLPATDQVDLLADTIRASVDEMIARLLAQYERYR